MPHAPWSSIQFTFKVAHVFNLNLVFTDKFFIIGNTNQVMQNPIPKLRQASIISKKKNNNNRALSKIFVWDFALFN